MYTPYITVLIDTYNYGHFIQEAIDSVLAQDFPQSEMEVLVVDDGSTDDTARRVAKYAGRVQYLYKNNGGQASAFTFGMERARGEIVALLDADDYWLPSKLKRVAEEFRTHPEAGLVYHPFHEFHMETGEWKEGSFEAISGNVCRDRKQMLLYTAVQTSGLTFRTNLVKQFLPLAPEMTIQADGLLAALIIFLAPIVAIPEPLAVYRIHGSNLYFHSSKAIDRERQARRVKTLQVILSEMDNWFQSHGVDAKRDAPGAFRRRWQHLYETEEFLLDAPGRLRFFWHLSRSMRNMSPCLTKRIQMVNGVNALGSLFTGYKQYRRLDEWRGQIKQLWKGAKSAAAPQTANRIASHFGDRSSVPSPAMIRTGEKFSVKAK